MLNYISGVLDSVELNSIVVEAGGVGYEISVSQKLLSTIGKVGEKVRVYVYLSVKDDGAFLFGFCDKAERSMFLRLITISGIGPKLALSILSGISPLELSRCIANGDSKSLSSLKGIGKKTAERIILELRDKIEEEIDSSKGFVSTSNQSIIEEAESALMALGFTLKEAKTLVGKVNVDGLSATQIVMQSLKKE